MPTEPKAAFDALADWCGRSPAQLSIRQEIRSRGGKLGCLRGPRAEIMADTLDSKAAAFAQLLKLSGDPDAAFRSAVALANGLFPHQIEGVAFLLGRRRAILADDMGLGKTRQAIVSLRHLTPGGPRLVVCPASVKQNWAREIAVVAPDSSILLIEGTRPIPLTAEW